MGGEGRVRGSHVGIGPRATSLFGLVFESAGICRTFVVWSQDWGLCLKARIRCLKVRARFSAHSAQVRGKVGLPTQLETHWSVGLELGFGHE